MVYSWLVEKLNSKPKSKKPLKKRKPYNNICNLPNIDYDFYHYTEIKTDKSNKRTE